MGDSDSSDSEDKKKKRKTAPKKKKRKSKDSESLLTPGNFFFMLVLAGIGYCRYNHMKVPLLDDFMAKFGLQFGGGGGGRGSAPVYTADSTLNDALAGKPMAVED